MHHESLLNKYKHFIIPEGRKEANMLAVMKLIKAFDNPGIFAGTNKEQEKNVELMLDYFSMTFGAYESSDIHIFRIDPDITGLILKTDSDIKYMPLPFSYCFVDSIIPINENISLQGLMLNDMDTDKIDPRAREEFNKIEGISDELKNVDAKCIFIHTVAICSFKTPEGIKKYFLPVFTSMGLGKGVVLDDELKNALVEDPIPHIQNFVCSFLNFLNTPDIEVIKNTYSEKSIRKSLEKSKLIRKSDNIIKLTGKAKIYLDSLRNISGGKIDWSHKFWIRGHFMHLESARYTHKRGQTAWRVPHLRGIGELIKKEYELQ